MMFLRRKVTAAEENAHLLWQILLRLSDERTKEELKILMCDHEPFWSSQTFRAALREALSRGWIIRSEDTYGVFYTATENGRSK